tara:strand:+ start:289 stop:729 length:441 start_codon:yes stop_codon:yes gene_type:complete
MSNPETCIFLSDKENCSLGLHDGTPKAGDCLACEKRVPVTLKDGKRVFSSVDVHVYTQALMSCVNDEWPLESIPENSKPNEETTDKSRGLGDTIAKMTNAVGIKPCGGCKKRQAMLNKAFPYKQKSEQDDAEISEPDTTDNSPQAD